MRHLSSLITSSFAASAALFVFSLSGSASAHIELLNPAPRYQLPSNKSCPCGDGDSNRRCEDTAENSHDPNRSTNVTTLEAGSTITVLVDEYIDHAGRMRVAFDEDGADLADFNQRILADIPDPSGTDGKQWEISVTLPSEPCDNCTLQVIQAMDGNTEDPVLDPAPISTYYSCADIRLVPAGTLESGEQTGGGTSGAAGTASAAEAGAGGQGGASGGAAGAAGAGDDGPSAAGTGAAAGSVSSSDDDDADDEGGCAFEPARSGGAWASSLVLLGLLAARTVRRRARG